MFSGLPFCTIKTGPYHQAGPEKLITFRRSAVTWISAPIASMRCDSSEGMIDSQGTQTTLIFLIPSTLSTALLISQSIPAGCLFSYWYVSGGLTLKPTEIPFLTAFSYDGSPQFATSGFIST